MHRLVDAQGECATARACGRAGALFGHSQHATRSIEDVASAARGAQWWYSTYLLKDRDTTIDLVRRAVAAGSRGIFLTVDSARFGFREADARNGFNAPPLQWLTQFTTHPLTLANYERPPLSNAAADAWDLHPEALLDPTASWDAVSWLCGELDKLPGGAAVPLVVKGIMSGADASLAIEHGADGVFVSKHGERQADETLGSLVQGLRHYFWDRISRISQPCATPYMPCGVLYLVAVRVEC